jgi:tRNA(fMet)-specific endonuclease VapC
MAIIIDANVIIKGERGAFDLRTWLTFQSDTELQIASITVAELWHGVERASLPYRLRRERYVRSVIERLDVLPYTESTALRHAQIWATLEASGRVIGPYDLILAATALEHKSAVATFNKRHFECVEGLRVIEPAS